VRSHRISTFTGLVASLLVAATAEAHVSVASGPAFANKSQKITFGIGHGCDGADTVAVRVEIPDGLSGVRALTSDFGKPSFEKNGANVTAVTWRKPLDQVLDEDLNYYELTIRARVADLPFNRIRFRVHQTCRTAAGVESTVDWTALPGETGNEAPTLIVVPVHQPGWNKFVLGAAATIAAADLPTFFADAQIVWSGSAAYSPSATTAALIGGTAGVTVLAGDVPAGQELWVRY
jgi:uncharacterized protein YcnI